MPSAVGVREEKANMSAREDNGLLKVVRTAGVPIAGVWGLIKVGAGVCAVAAGHAVVGALLATSGVGALVFAGVVSQCAGPCRKNQEDEPCSGPSPERSGTELAGTDEKEQFEPFVQKPTNSSSAAQDARSCEEMFLSSQEDLSTKSQTREALESDPSSEDLLQ